MINLRNYVTVITGGSSGLGEATVKKVIEKGAKVAVIDWNNKRAQEMTEFYGKDKFMFVNTDVSKEEECSKAIDQVANKFGGVHFLLNSAGIFKFGSLLGQTQKKMTSSDLEDIFRVNVFGSLYMTRYAAEKMLKNQFFSGTQQKGAVVFISSIAGEDGWMPGLAYSGSKAAIKGINLCLMRELGPLGIRVNNVSPGLFYTGMTKDFGEDLFENIKKITPLNKTGNPEELGDLIVSMFTNTFLHGATIRIDGGVRI